MTVRFVNRYEPALTASGVSCEHDHEQAASLRKLHADLEKTVEETSKANRRSEQGFGVGRIPTKEWNGNVLRSAGPIRVVI